jgi:arylsulfatase
MKKILSFTIGLSILISTQLIAQQKNTSPNIILIYMDDMGYGDLSCYGAVDIQTPVLDKMAAEGMRFTNFLTTQAVCSASRMQTELGYQVLCGPRPAWDSHQMKPRSQNC